jgi:hypothetical protein
MVLKDLHVRAVWARNISPDFHYKINTLLKRLL